MHVFFHQKLLLAILWVLLQISINCLATNSTGLPQMLLLKYISSIEHNGNYIKFLNLFNLIFSPIKMSIGNTPHF